jgi:hypothetical protein
MTAGLATVVVVGLMLTGCAQMRDQMIANDNRYCQSMGLKFGTPDFAQCRMVIDARRDRQFSEGVDMMAKGLSNRKPETKDDD